MVADSTHWEKTFKIEKKIWNSKKISDSKKEKKEIMKSRKKNYGVEKKKKIKKVFRNREKISESSNIF